MKLVDLEQYDDFTIQCHDNPDADAIASGYGLYCYYKSKGKNVKLIYSGTARIQKSNLLLMIQKLNIPIEYMVPEIAENYKVKGMLITVDCQYGAGNVTRLQADRVAIIDHHQLEIENFQLLHVISDIGSCSTIVWMMLREAGYVIDDSDGLGTALYYGLLTDTNHFSEVKNPLDRDAQDGLKHDNSMIDLFCNSNISLHELEIAGIAMLRYVFNAEYGFAIIKTQPCDANILGLISDFLLQVDKIFVCVVYNDVPGGYKLSVRSCIREVNASELASFISDDMGSGGGHYRKAGGFISKALYEKKIGAINSEAYFINRIIEYYKYYDKIYAKDYEVDLNKMQKMQKKNIPMGYVVAKDILPVGTPITVRTLEGDIDITVEDDLIIMIGVEGEVYPNKLEKFNRAYKEMEGKYKDSETAVNMSYEPTVINRLNGSKHKLIDFARNCISTGNIQIYACEIDKPTKVFTEWDKEKYMLGMPGDFLAARSDDLHDIYICRRDIYFKTYAPVE